ncbi:MAG TPA: alkaline phosphatase D family protein, partial [Humisphaera sp.]
AASAPSALAAPPAPAAGAPAFKSQWHRCHDRPWLGPDVWANPMQDWRLVGGRAECVNAAFDRNVHLLALRLTDKPAEFTTSVTVGRVGGGKLGPGKGSFGFRVGVRAPFSDDPRAALVAGQGINCGVTAEGGLFIGPFVAAKPGTVPLDAVEQVRLTLTCAAAAAGGHKLTLAVHDPAGKPLGSVTRDVPAAEQSLAGNLALVANFGAARPAAARQAARANAQQPNAAQPNAPQPPNFGTGSFWFADWTADGPKLVANDPAVSAFGPVLWTTYTVHNRTLKLTAQLPPMGPKESKAATLMVQDTLTKQWRTTGDVEIDPDARTATFRVERWKTKFDVAYRVLYTQIWADGATTEHEWTGVVRRDPVDQPVLTVADVSCNGHQAFPNAPYVAEVAKLKPDLLAFVGDQFYEQSGGYGVTRKPVETAVLDYLRKWYLHGWTWRELTRSTPSLSLPDDHDVYQGNIWGEGGNARKSTQEAGGYDMDGRWVNVVYRTQTAHHPDPFDPKPAAQGILNYYGPYTLGRVSFAVLADRMYKSGPEGKVPPTGGRGDHVKDPKWDPKTADVPGLQLLGETQLKFLKEWAADWRGTDLKAVISQTIFAAMATHHGQEREVLRADYDANGWPQTPRNAALREIRKCFAVHIAGDQHLPAVVHYGVDAQGDAGVAFAGPAVNVTYPRWFEPAEPGKNRKPGAAEGTGDFADSFGHPMRVLAVANPKRELRKPVLENLVDKASGIGVVRLDKTKQTATFECWPIGADVAQPNTQFPGWPLTVGLTDNYGRAAFGHLPGISIQGTLRPVVQVYKQ